MARSNLITCLLVVLVAIAVLFTGITAVFYVWSVRKHNVLQLQAAVINRNRNLANSLVAEAVEYSRRNPAIDPILQSIGAKPRPGQPAALAAPKP